MNSKQVLDIALNQLSEWYEEYRLSDGNNPERYVVCAGLAVLEILRGEFPLERADYITPGNQVKTSGQLIRNILNRYGESRVYAREGGRTTRGTVPAAEQLVERINAIDEIRNITESDRESIVDRLQKWLVDRVKEYFGLQRIGIEIDLGKSTQRIITEIVLKAGNKAGAVAQHLVGAKLALRYPELIVENHSYTTADMQLGRPGDFLVGDSVFHVTMSPMPAVIEKCLDNVRNGYRAILITPDARLQASRQMAEALNVEDAVGIYSLESFVGQNIDELAGFNRQQIAAGMLDLLQKYNERVSGVETDQSLLFEIPSNLGQN